MANASVSPGLVVSDGKDLHSSRVLLVDGVVQRVGDVVNLIVQCVAALAINERWNGEASSIKNELDPS